jgi:PAS domain S-box-containing protein
MIYAEQPVKRVLYISSYHPAFPTFNRQLEGINSVLNKRDIILDIEFMDTKRLPGYDNVRNFHRMLSAKLQKLSAYDAVIAADDAALLYAVENGGNLFKNIPVFFCGVNDIEKAAAMEKSSMVRGVVEVVSIRETLDLIVKLFPDRTKLAVIADNTLTGSSDLKNFIKVSEIVPLKIEILSLKDYTFEQMNSRLRDLGDDYSILLLSAYTDSTGLTKSFREGLSGIISNSSVPVFHLWEHGMGDGIFGGKIVRHYEQGREAAGMVLSYFSGIPLSGIRNVNDSPNRYSFDYNQLQKFGISLFQLPEESIVLNKPLSFYENYKALIITSGGVILALLSIVFILFIESRRLKNMVKARTEELAENEERWKFSLEGAGQVVWDWNLNNNRIFISRKWNEALGLDNEETFADIEEWFKDIHEDDRDNTRSIMNKHLNGEKSLYENFHRIKAKDGAYRWVLSRGKVIERTAEGRPQRVIGTATDVTELKQIEEEISKSRRMLQMVLDTIPIGVFWKDSDLTYLGCNNSFARLIGIESAERVVGKKDIEIFDAEIARMYNKTDREILNTGRPILNYEDHLVLPTGKVRILRKSKVPLTGTDGAVFGVLGTYEDVTVQKNLREETFRIQKLESVGILASGIAHDFNNLLMAISGSLSVLRLSEDITGKSLHWIENAEKSCLAATELTTRLITFSRGGAPVLQEENIVEIINEAVDSGRSGSSVVINYKNESPVISAMVDGRQVRQVFINLIENSKDAMPGGGEIHIVSSEINLENNNRFELKTGGYLMITLKDTGPGIPENVIDKIFDPYFSTKEMGPHKGQGLGLAISHSIITQHGGKITVSSIPGKGALFTIYIPFSR